MAAEADIDEGSKECRTESRRRAKMSETWRMGKLLPAAGGGSSGDGDDLELVPEVELVPEDL